MASNTITSAPPGDLWLSWKPAGPDVTCLTAAPMPNGQVFLLWMVGGWLTAVQGAVLNSPSAMLRDDAVSEGSKFTVHASNAYSCSTFAHGGNLYYSLQYVTGAGGTGYHRIYKADDPNNPAGGFTLYSTVQAFGLAVNSIFDQVGMAQAGHPWIEGSRWVYSGGAFVNIFGYYSAYVGLWVSNDNGVNWTQHVHQGIGALGANTHFIAPQIMEQADGKLYFSAHGASDQVLRWESTDRGASWSFLWNESFAPILSGLTLYEGNTYTLELSSVVKDNDLSTSAGSSLVSTHPTFYQRNMGRAVDFGGYVYLFGGKDVQFPAGGWNVGFHHVRIA